MKKSLFALVLALIFAITPISAFAATDLSGIAFDDESATPALSVTGYPRFEMLEDGTLALVNSTAIRFSNDNGATWSRKNMHTNAATEKTTASGTTHTLTLENWQPYVLEDGTIFVSYRARTKGYDESVGGEFYTSIRLMSSTDNGQTFDNEVILAEDVVDDAMLGFWEPFIIQIDDAQLHFTMQTTSM